MKYLIGTIIVICVLLTFSGVPHQTIRMEFPVIEEANSEIICETDNNFTCVENITFPAMYITAQSR